MYCEPQRQRLALTWLIAATIATPGCATWNPFGSLFEKEQSPPSARRVEDRPYYTAEPGVKLYAEPRFSSSYTAELPLHQKVYRSGLEHGFAYVEVEGSGQKGWVDNGKLIWRLPAALPAAAAVPAPADEPAPASAAAEQAPPADDPNTAVAPAEPLAEQAPSAAEAPPAAAVEAQNEDGSVDPSLFSPF